MAKVVGFIGIRRPDSRINSLAHLHLASTPCEQLSPQWQYRVLLGSSSHNLLCSQIPPAQQFAASESGKHIQDSDRRRKIDIVLHTEMKLSLTSARLYPTALISCPPAAVAETVPFRLCRRSSGTGATDSAQMGSCPPADSMPALFLNFVLDDEHDGFKVADCSLFPCCQHSHPLALFAPA